MDILSMDKNMFLSIVNMKLRDEFSSIYDLCSYYDISSLEMDKKLDEFGLIYVESINQLRNR